MLSLYHRIQKIESLQKAVDKEVRQCKNHTGIECQQHCAQCCNYQDITASPAEFLPFAWHAWRLGLLDQWFDELEKHDSSICVFARFSEGSWGCRIYPARGLICRLFGFSATTDKNGHPLFAACRVLRQARPELVQQVTDYLARGGKIPIIAHYYQQLSAIEPALGREMLPINQAIKKALEIIYFHFSYRECA
ncbi:MAG: fe-S-cluster oxidoreductase [uncultured bacterium]|nr:MAG: fe-S-cluster oxidoreductase [uncultured bacterium]